MGKIILLLLILAAALTSCNKTKVYPIERYKGCVLVDKINYNGGWMDIRLKSKDSIFDITVIKYDSNRFSIGDTIQ